MKLNEKIGNQIMIGISGTSLNEKEKEFITKNNIAGVTLFSRNIENPEQLTELVAELQSLRMHTANKAPLFIAIDMEGGRVMRLKAPFTKWPAIRHLGEIDSATLTYRFAECMGHELMAAGINIDFAPCVDILTNPENELIGDRSIGSDPNLVGKHASALVRGYINSGIIACAKHYPGHGNTIIDSHEDLPVDETDLDTLKEREISAFKKAFRARVDLVMTAHILYKNVDPDYPATFSKKLLKEILPDTGYKKLVISDDLDMKALTKHYDINEIPLHALNAGCNILLYCNEEQSPYIAIEEIIKAVENKKLDLALIEENYKKVVTLKADRIKQVGPLPKAERDKIIGCEEHQNMALCIRENRLPDDIKS
tara:strand:- start:634 stop:1740 length:1107 start_codon:yes stop_codon:yes gene_type:complete